MMYHLFLIANKKFNYHAMRQEQDVSVHFPLKNTPIDYQLTELWYFTCPHPKTDRFGVGQLPRARRPAGSQYRQKLNNFCNTIYELVMVKNKLDADDSCLKVLG